MCIAIVTYDDAGEGACPTHEDLEAMADCNPHGAGLAWPDDGPGALVYMKGLKTPDVEYLLRHVPRPVLVHFRWATHGGRADHLTHPFPLGPAALVSDATEGLADKVLIHNGTWAGYDKQIPDWLDPVRRRTSKYSPPDGVSDTSVAAHRAMFDEKTLREVPWCTAILRYRPDDEGHRVTIRGDWHQEAQTWFSNFNWRARVKGCKR